MRESCDGCALDDRMTRVLFPVLTVIGAVLIYDAHHGWEPNPWSLDELMADEDGAIDDQAADAQEAGEELYGSGASQLPCICMTELRRDGVVRPHDAHNQQYCDGLLSRLPDVSATRP
jgi:hypothetical protein